MNATINVSSAGVIGVRKFQANSGVSEAATHDICGVVHWRLDLFAGPMFVERAEKYDSVTCKYCRFEKTLTGSRGVRGTTVVGRHSKAQPRSAATSLAISC